MRELGTSAGQIHNFADQVGVRLRHELIQVHIDIIQLGSELGRVVVPQVGRVQMTGIRLRHDERPLRLRHLLAADGQKPMDAHLRWK